MNMLQNAVTNLTQAARWKPALPGADGSYVFHLGSGLDFTVFSPDDTVCILRAEVKSLSGEAREVESLLQRCAALVVACCRERSSVLSVADGVLHLHSILPCTEAVTGLPTAARNFLNDLAWWRNQVEHGETRAFSCSMPPQWQGR